MLVGLSREIDTFYLFGLMPYSYQINPNNDFSYPQLRLLEDNLADYKLKKVGKKLRLQFNEIKKLNKQITPKEIIKARKEFRTSVIVRNIYSEVLNIIQAATMSKLSRKKYNSNEKKYLEDALMTSIAGISAAMKNTG